ENGIVPPLYGEGRRSEAEPGWGTPQATDLQPGGVLRAADSPTASASPTFPPHEGEGGIARYLSNRELLTRSHAYDATSERDACGVGLVCAIDGKPRREVVELAIRALKAVWHRGAVDADGKTGDGAGVLVSVPQDFFAEQVRRIGHTVRPGPIAVGQ